MGFKLFADIIAAIITALLEVFPKEKIVEAIDSALDKIEDKVAASPNKFDDIIVLPLIKKLIREPFGIEDGDD